jgi:hypothetical protein
MTGPRRSSKPETSRKTSQPDAGAKLRKPATGKGYLRSGGKPGNKGGTGRPKSEVREACLRSFEERIPLLGAIADDPNAHPIARIKALEALAKYGLGTKDELEVRAELRQPVVILPPLDE